MKKSVKITLILAISAIVIAAISITAIGIYQNSPNYRLSLAERYLSEMNYEQAIIEFEKLVEIEPQNVDYWLKLAEAYEKNGQLDKAKEALERALSYIDDDRLRTKLADIELLLNPPQPVVTTATVTTTAPIIEEPVSDYLELNINQVEDGEIYSRGENVYVSFKDEQYAFASIEGQLLTNYEYSKVNNFWGNEEKACGYVEKSSGDKLIISNSLDTIVDVTNATYWCTFNEEEPLIAVFYAGTVINETFDESTPIQSDLASFKIFKYDGTLLYEYNDGDGLRGNGIPASVKDLGMTELSNEWNCTNEDCIRFKEKMGINYPLIGVDIQINKWKGLGIANNKLLIWLDISAKYKSHADYPDEAAKYEEILKKEREEELNRQHPDGWVSGFGWAWDGHSASADGWYEVSYSNQEIAIVKSDLLAPSIRDEENYSIYAETRLGVGGTQFYLTEGTNTLYSSILPSWQYEPYGEAIKFESINNGDKIFKDFALCYKEIPSGSGTYCTAVFKPKWYTDSDQANKKNQDEWSQLSSWFGNIGIINSERKIFWVYDPSEDESNPYYIYQVTDNDDFVKISNGFSNLSWDAEIPEVIVGEKSSGAENADDENKEYFLYTIDLSDNSTKQTSGAYDSISLSSEKYFLVSKNEKWGYIDINGNELDFYDDASNFSDGYAIVTVNGEGWLINEEFEQVSEKFNSESAHILSEGKFAVTFGDEQKIVSVKQ